MPKPRMPKSKDKPKDETLRKIARELTRTSRREQGLPAHVENHDALAAAIAAFGAATHP